MMNPCKLKNYKGFVFESSGTQLFNVAIDKCLAIIPD